MDEAEKNRPKSFVFKRGKVPPLVQELVQDMRRVMEPYTATNLKDKRNNSVKDFIKIAAPLGVSHFMFFTSTENSTHMKIARLPRGPTLSFQVLYNTYISFSLLIICRYIGHWIFIDPSYSIDTETADRCIELISHVPAGCLK